jgi:hypothetical protein
VRVAAAGELRDRDRAGGRDDRAFIGGEPRDLL